jgi:hypothetical protein
MPADEGQPRIDGVDESDKREILDPQDQDNPDEGPTMTPAGAAPGGNAMDHWKTAMPSADATKPETMPDGGTTPKTSEGGNPA